MLGYCSGHEIWSSSILIVERCVWFFAFSFSRFSAFVFLVQTGKKTGIAFSALTLLEEHPAYKNWVMRCWCGYVWSTMLVICIWSSWCHCYAIISCFIKIQIGLTFLVPAYQIVLEKRSLNGCLSDLVQTGLVFQVLNGFLQSDSLNVTPYTVTLQLLLRNLKYLYLKYLLNTVYLCTH